VLQTAVKFIEQHRLQGGRALVYCKAGHGRSAAVAFAWLIHCDPTASLASIQKHLLQVRKKLYTQQAVLAFAVQHRVEDAKTKNAVGSDGKPGLCGTGLCGSEEKVMIFTSKWKSLLFAIRKVRLSGAAGWPAPARPGPCGRRPLRTVRTPLQEGDADGRKHRAAGRAQKTSPGVRKSWKLF